MCQEEGFGVITEIDVKEAFQKKLGIEFRNYRILGACNPALPPEALELEDKVGTMLPCIGGQSRSLQTNQPEPV